MARPRHMHSYHANLRGRVGDLVYKWYGKRLVITRAPRKSTKAPTAQKLASCRDFSAGSAYAQRARKDEDLWAIYAADAKPRKIPARALAISDYRTWPTIAWASFDWGPAGCVRVATRDKFPHKTVAVHVVVKREDGLPLAQGPAVMIGPQRWRFTTSLDASQRPALEVTALDRFRRKTIARFRTGRNRWGQWDAARVATP